MAIARAALEASASLDDGRSRLSADLVYFGLGEAARAVMEAIMSATGSRRWISSGARCWATAGGLGLLGEELRAATEEAAAAGVEARLGRALQEAVTITTEVVAHLGAQARGDLAGALAHATDFLDLISTVVVAWQWLKQATAATTALTAGREPQGFLRGKLAAAAGFFDAELPRVTVLAHRCREDRSYVELDPRWL